MTTTEKRLGDIADRLDVIAKAIGKLTKERTQDAPIVRKRQGSGTICGRSPEWTAAGHAQTATAEPNATGRRAAC